MKIEGVDVVQDEVTLCGLVELKLQHLRAVLVGPLSDDFGDRFGRHATGYLLSFEELVGGDANHKLHFGLDTRLSICDNGNRKGSIQSSLASTNCRLRRDDGRSGLSVRLKGC